MNLGRWVTVAEVLALAAIAYGLYYGWEKLTAGASQVSDAIASAFDNNVDPAYDPATHPEMLPNPNPTSVGDVLQNSTVSGVIPPGMTADQWINYETTGVYE